jgi:hypothetical protein
MLVLGFYPAPALRLVDQPAAESISQVGVVDAPQDIPVAVTGDDEGSEQ